MHATHEISIEYSFPNYEIWGKRNLRKMELNYGVIYFRKFDNQLTDILNAEILKVGRRNLY